MGRRIIINQKNNHFKRLVDNKFFEWLLYLLGYAFVLILVSGLFHKTFYISSKHYGLYAVLAAFIIYILNQTVKPVLFYLTLPLTALTFGLFYPIINLLILYITSFILGSNFELHGVVIPFLIAIVISVLNMLMEGMIIKPIINKNKEEK